MDELLATFIFFFAVIDPVGTVPVFAAVTKGFTTKQKRQTAVNATFVSFFVLIFFIILGEPLLNAINVSLPAFQIAGGIVLFLFALTMIFGDSKPEAEKKSIINPKETAIFPLAIPSIASPGAMLAAVLLTQNSEYSISEQFLSSVMMTLVLLCVLVLLLISEKILRVIGDSGASMISRIMGLILTSVAVSSIIEGVKMSFSLQ